MEREAQAIFSTNQDFVRGSEGWQGRTAYLVEEVCRRPLLVGQGRETQRFLALKLQESPQLIAIVDLMRPHPHPSSDYDALGLLILHRAWQGKGLGLEAAGALENVLHLVVRSREVLASPAKNPAKRFPTTLVEWKPAPSLCAIGKVRINPS